jgi:hypothetical protein
MQHFEVYAVLFVASGPDNCVLLMFDNTFRTKTLRMKNSAALNLKEWLKNGGKEPYTLVETDELKIVLPATVRYVETVILNQRSEQQRLAAPQTTVGPVVK